MLITQIWKNDRATGLSDVVSYLYAHKDPRDVITVTFETSEWVKSLSLYWKSATLSDWSSVKGYAYIVPRVISSTNKDEEFFTTKQDMFIPAVTNTLFQLGFKDQSQANLVKDKRDTTQVKDLFETSTTSFDEVTDNFSFDEINKTIEEKKEWKLGTIEILHKLFNAEGQTVAWPKEIEYKTLTEGKKSTLPTKVKAVHLYKKLMWTTMIDSPIQELTNFTISGSSFNVLATGNQPLVLETIDGKFIESKQYRAKILVSNGRVRIPYLYARLNRETFNEFIENGVLQNEVYLKDKFYKINLESSATGTQIPLVNKKVLQIPQEEIVNLVYDIDLTKVRQTVYNSKIKELNKLTGVFQEFIKPDFEKSNKEYGIDSKGAFSTDSEEDTDPKIKDSHITNSISISVLKFPEAEMLKKETAVLDSYLQITDTTGVDQLLAKKEDLVKKVAEIKKSLEEKRYKLALISNTLFINWFSDKLKYDTGADGKVDMAESTKAAGVVGGVKNVRILSSKDWKIKVRVQLFKTEKLV